MRIELIGVSKITLLTNLFNNAVPPIDDTHGPIYPEETTKLIVDKIKKNEKLVFDKLHGRHIHVDLSGDFFFTTHYTAYNGDQAIINVMKSTKNLNKVEIPIQSLNFEDMIALKTLYDENTDFIKRFIELCVKLGPDGIKILDKFIMDKFPKYYKPFKEFFSENKEDE